eukprot:m.160643 g.160643  ORF g.160643 m.160643 type:complete len:496 (-) comp18031_c0_seq1:113-1600(-)
MGKDGNVGLDASARPLHTPRSYADYAEKHGIFDLMHDIAKDLVLNTPADPLARIVEFLEEPATPKIFIQGPIGSGRQELSKGIHAKSNAVQLEINEVINAAVTLETPNGQAAAPFVSAGNIVPNSVLVPIVLDRLSEDDCKRNGYVLRGFPETRVQAVALQAAGILPTHVIFMEGSNLTSAIQNIQSRVQHPETNAVYSTLHNPPSEDVLSACIPIVNGPTETEIRESHQKFEQNLMAMRATYLDSSISADTAEPMDVLLDHVWKILTTKKQTAAPWIPRVYLIGPVGSRDDVFARNLAEKYGIVHVQLRQLMQQAIHAKASSSAVLAKALGPQGNGASQVPDSVLNGLVETRLSQLDCQTQGWVLTGFPGNAAQAQSLQDAGHKANRVFILEVDEETAVQRVGGRRTDPLTGQTCDVHTNPPAPDVSTRLTVHPRDTEASIRTQLQSFNQQYTDLSAVLDAQAVHVDANDPDENLVMNIIDSHLIYQRQDTIAC